MLLHDKVPRDCVVCRQVSLIRMELTSYDRDGLAYEGFWSHPSRIRPDGARELLRRLRGDVA